MNYGVAIPLIYALQDSHISEKKNSICVNFFIIFRVFFKQTLTGFLKVFLLKNLLCCKCI